MCEKTTFRRSDLQTFHLVIHDLTVDVRHTVRTVKVLCRKFIPQIYRYFVMERDGPEFSRILTKGISIFNRFSKK